MSININFTPTFSDDVPVSSFPMGSMGSTGFFTTSSESNDEPAKKENLSPKIREKIDAFNTLPQKLSEFERDELKQKSAFIKTSLDIDDELAHKVTAKALKNANPQGFTRINKCEANLSATINKNHDIYVHNKKIIAKGSFKKASKSTFYNKNNNGSREEVIRLKVSKNFNSYNDINEAEQEVKLHMSLDHENIVKIKEYNRYLNSKNEECLEIFEEVCDSTFEKADLTPNETLQVMIDTASALEYLHDKGLVHNDLKPDNILIKNKRGKLADFGLSREIGKSPPTRCVKTLAPEFENDSKETMGPSSTASDVYQLGLMLKSSFMFEQNKPLQKLMDACLQDDPSKRPTMREVRETLEKVNLQPAC